MTIRVHVTKNGKRYFQLYYVDPITERRVWRSTQTTERRAAERAAAKWEAELAEGAGTRPNRLTWGEFRDRFEREHLASLADKTVMSYRTALNAFEAEIDPARLATVTADTLSRFASQLRTRGNLSETSISTYLQHIASALSWAAGLSLIPKAPRKPKGRGSRQARHKPATADELTAMLLAVPSVPDCAHDVDGWRRYLHGLNLSGLRLGESLRVSWDPDGPFTVQQSAGQWIYRIQSAGQKSRKTQDLPITPDFAALLESTPPEDRHGLVFPLRGKSGRSIRGQATVSRALEAIADQAGCQVRAHDFRRAFGTRWAVRVPAPILQKLMRHRSISTTMRYYVHLDVQDISAALQAWQSLEVNPLLNPAPSEPKIEASKSPARNEKTRCSATG